MKQACCSYGTEQVVVLHCFVLDCIANKEPDLTSGLEVNALSLQGLGTNEKTLIEVICTRTNAQLTAMKEAYKTSKTNCVGDAIADV